jgi:hypothetical protein
MLNTTTNHLTATQLRRMLQETLPAENLELNTPPPPHQFFVPKSHALALNRQIPFVIGDYGAGKSFWSTALQSPNLRKLLTKAAPDTRIGTNTIVRAGFNLNPQTNNHPTKEDINTLHNITAPPHVTWKTIAFWNILHALDATDAIEGLPADASWQDRVTWVAKHPELIDRLMNRFDEQLNKHQQDILLVFDTIESPTDDVNHHFALLEGLTQVALNFRAFRNIRTKVFLHTNQFENPRISRSPNANRLKASSARLQWYDTELFGLLWSLLGNHLTYGALYRDDLYGTLGLQSRNGIRDGKVSGEWIPPSAALFDKKTQERLFHRITGPYMGDSPRRGFPYGWLPAHLADARGTFTPRSFLTALKTAAEHTDAHHSNHQYAIHYRSLHASVRAASQTRISEIRNQPWVEPLITALKEQSVPFKLGEAHEKWLTTSAYQNTHVQITGINSPEDAHKQLTHLGIWRMMKTGDIYMPDIYRLGFNLPRRGGVPLKHNQKAQ